MQSLQGAGVQLPEIHVKRTEKNDKKLVIEEEKTRQHVKSKEEVSKEYVESSKVRSPNPVKAYVPPIPFPHRLQKNKLDKLFEKFLEIFQKLHINIPFADALVQMPLYLKFMKEMLSKKRKLDENEIVALTVECSAILLNKLPPKLKDPGVLNYLAQLENFIILMLYVI
ncbi:Uncharacterized protein Adt_11890 [Abeliophyllum distichum]|uniref:Reverse transcriptase domain-containing protein n=1 Tax=Abeliophyllum distichum TaxID=126358 RepID=A0ABD1UPE6_9LAMI